jgi:hypothetical protein
VANELLTQSDGAPTGALGDALAPPSGRTNAMIQRSRRIVSAAAWCLLWIGSGGLASAAAAPRSASAVTVGRAVRRGVLPRPLREMKAPRRQPPAEPARPAAPQSHAPSRTAGASDPVVQRQRVGGVSAPTQAVQFDGASYNDDLPFFKSVFPPPDANSAAGPDHVFETINLVFKIFDKSGTLVAGPLPNSTLWSGLGGVCETERANTPIVKYDVAAGRWLVSQNAFDPSDGSTHQCIVVSTTADPTGLYYQYDFTLDARSVGTSARIGIWPEAYYMTVNQFQGFARAGVGFYAFDRAAILAGGDTTVQYADAGAANPDTFWALPSDLDGSAAPPAGAANTGIALGADFLDGSPAQVLHVWQFHADFGNPDDSTFDGPVDVAIAAFAPLDCGNATQGDGCVPQLDSEQEIYATPSQLMYRLAYRNFGDHESLVSNFTVDGADGGGRAAIRWFEVRDPRGAPAVFQEGTYAPDSSYRFVGSIAMDRNGNAALGYTKSDGTIHPTAAVTGRLAGDPAGTMGTEDAFFQGPNSLPPILGVWGDYSSMVLDPADDCTFWFTSEYIGVPSPLFESSRIGAFKFPSCTSGPTGALAGTVTESSSGNPIAGARVTAGASETVTDAAGHYQFLALPVGAYDMTVTKFGYVPAAASGVQVQAGETTTQDFLLALAPQALLNGTVRDGSGGGWPLYARVTVSAPEFGSQTLFTDPVTGYYGITLVTGVTYTLATEAVLPGYLPDVRSLLLSSARLAPNGVQHILLTVDAVACDAPGFQLAAQGLDERFDGGVLPLGWQALENAGGIGWTIHSGADPCGLFGGNDTGGTGAFALVNSHCEGEVSEDAELITPSVDASALSSVQVRFDQDFNGGSPAFGEIADVDVSTDAGATWTNVLHQTVAVAGPNPQSIDVTALAAGQPDVRARFHYYNAFAALWWQVDDVVLGFTTCEAGSGGLLVGNVFDANTGGGIVGATVVNEAGGPTAVSLATPEDPAQSDGLYVLFSPSATQSITADALAYAPETKSVAVVPGAALHLDFHLTAGRLDASPRPLSVRVDPGEVVTRTLDIANDGSSDAAFALDELNAPPPGVVPAPVVLADPAARAAALGRVPAGGADARTARGLAALPAPPVRPLAAGNVVNAYPANLDAPWGLAFDVDAGDFWVSNSAPFVGDGLDYRFTTGGAQTGDTIDDTSWIADFAADGAYDPRTVKLWRVNVGGDDCVYELDPVVKVATGRRICPAFGTSQRGLAYDVITDTWYSGSWNDGVIHRFDALGNILGSFYVGVAVSGLAFDPGNGRLYALTNHDVLLGFDVYVFDTRNGMAAIGAFNVTSGGVSVLSPNGGAGMDFACDGHLWLVDSASATIYEVETGETDVCGFMDIPWLSEDPSEGTVSAGGSLPVTCTFDSTGLSAGARLAQLLVPTDTPYPVALVPVDFTVRFADVTDGSLFDLSIYAAAGAGVMPGCDPAAFLFCPTAQVTRADMAGFILRAVHGPSFVPTPYAGAFSDVHAGDYNADYIQSFYDEGYTVGCGGGNFCPNAVHTRAQTAVFILKGKHGTSHVPPSCSTTHAFDDVPCPPTPEAPFGDWIGELFVEGITAGCGGNNFCPAAGIPNQQMAAFLVKAFGIPLP